MSTNSINFFVRFFINIVVSFFLFSAVSAQNVAEIETKAFLSFNQKKLKCYVNAGNQTIDELKFQEILRKKGCEDLAENLKIDFSKQTLLSYRVGGDCLMRVKTQVFRNISEKKYIVRIKNLYGGCRAGGGENGWLVIDKIPPDYSVEFEEIKLKHTAGEKVFENDDFVLQTETKRKTLSKTLETREIDLKKCIQTIFTKQFVIEDEKSFLSAIRNDASRDYCLNNLKKIDFEKYSLLGKSINSGYCRRPVGLKVEAVENFGEKKYDVKISYIDPDGESCRAFSQYDLWLLVPKIPANYVVQFDVHSDKGVTESDQ